MEQSKSGFRKSPGKIWRIGIAIALVWTLFVVISISWNIYLKNHEIVEQARIQARAIWEKDIIYRRWNSAHGGVYAPVNEYTLPNPHLQVPNREITDSTGSELTLINPAYMTRQVFEIGAAEYDIWEHITSLKPIRSENAPDEWEIEALQRFESGVSEVDSITVFHGVKRLRLMRPLMTEQGCLQCHAKDGYKLGDVRGGISVSVPLAPLEENARSTTSAMLAGYGFLWLSGLIGIFFGSRHLDSAFRERILLISNQEKMIEELQDAMSKIKVLKGFIPICANCNKIRDDKGFWNQLEEYIAEHSDASFSHGICPDCLKELYPEYLDEK